MDHRAPNGGARVKSSRVLVSSYCCSTYRVADPFSSLDTFSSSSFGGPVIHPKADCEHPLLCLLGPGIASQERAISGSFQQDFAERTLIYLLLVRLYRGLQTQKWMLRVNYWMDHRAPNEGARKSIQGAKEICNPIGGTTL